jgi:hypothetical protein
MKNIHLLPTDKPNFGRYLVFNKENTLCIWDTELIGGQKTLTPHHIYITNDEEIKQGDYGLSKLNEIIKFHSGYDYRYYAKIILTTDQDLIKDGVQAIDDEFLDWFVKNPTCEFVDVIKEMYVPQSNGKISDGKISHEISLNPSDNTLPFYKIITPQESVCTLDALDTFENARLALRKHLLANKEKIAKDLKEIREKSNGIKQERVEEAANNFAKLLGNKHETIFALEENAFIEGAKWQAERMYSEEEVLELVLSRPGPYLTDEEIKEWFEQNKKK